VSVSDQHGGVSLRAFSFGVTYIPRIYVLYPLSSLPFRSSMNSECRIIVTSGLVPLEIIYSEETESDAPDRSRDAMQIPPLDQAPT